MLHQIILLLLVTISSIKFPAWTPQSVIGSLHACARRSQKAKAEGRMSAAMQNPETPNVGNAGLENKPDFSPEKMKKFGGYRWLPASDPAFLDVERCELLLIGASEDLKGVSLCLPSR